MKGDTHNLQDHCLTTPCSAKVRYLYHFVADTDDCSPNPCNNGGTCEDLFADFRCHCRPGWTGITCNMSLACNSMPCQNGGTCNTISDDHLGNYTYSCSCTPYWAGTNCDVDLACKDNPFQHEGTCDVYTNIDTGVSTYNCSCPPGMKLVSFPTVRLFPSTGKAGNETSIQCHARLSGYNSGDDVR